MYSFAVADAASYFRHVFLFDADACIDGCRRFFRIELLVPGLMPSFLRCLAPAGCQPDQPDAGFLPGRRFRRSSDCIDAERMLIFRCFG